PPEDIPKRVKHAALRRLHGIPDVKVEERVYQGEEAIGQGGALVLWAETKTLLLGADSLAERRKPSERVGEEAALSLRAEIESRATLDVHAADQLLVYLARARRGSRVRVIGVGLTQEGDHVEVPLAAFIEEHASHAGDDAFLEDRDVIPADHVHRLIRRTDPVDLHLAIALVLARVDNEPLRTDEEVAAGVLSPVEDRRRDCLDQVRRRLKLG